jgi:predicted enzyme related to lactoylglutathione lyase
VFGWKTSAFDLGEAEMTMCHVPGYEGGEPGQPVPRDVVATMLPPDDAPPHWSVDFWVHDVEATAGRAAELGGQVVVPPYEPLPGFKQAVLADPHGAGFSVSKVSAAG